MKKMIQEKKSQKGMTGINRMLKNYFTKNRMQKSRSFFLLGSMLILLSGSLFAQGTCTVEGAGSSEVNGVYTWNGTDTNSSNNPVFEHSSGDYFMHASSSGRWVIKESATSTSTSGSYYYASDDDDDYETPPGSGWRRRDGSNPVPTTFCGEINIQRSCYTALIAGFRHTLGVKEDGTLWAWGYNRFGQLGDGSTSDSSRPIQIGTDTDWLNISVGLHVTIALKTDGTLWSCGRNSSGELGNGTTTEQHDLLQIGTDTDWSHIQSGSYHCLALKTDGTLWAWGDNTRGQLGDGTNTTRHSPVQIGTDTDWSEIRPGSSSSIALKMDGTLWAWGDNGEGQLGDGTTSHRNSPVQIGMDTDWTQAEISGTHSMALKTDGTLWTWGGNSAGQLGNGTTIEHFIPTQMGVETNWSQVKSGAGHSISLKTDGTLWCWGSNFNGQVGDGTTTNKLNPTQIGINTDWSNVYGDGYTSMGQRTSGLVMLWGSNFYGNIGDGTTENRHSPISYVQIDVPQKGISSTSTSNADFVEYDWTYYYNDNDGGLLFAINWAPDGSLDASNGTASDNTIVTIDVMTGSEDDTDGADASFIMGRYWNVDTDGNSFNEPVNIRYYYDPTEVSDIESAAYDYSVANSSTVRELQWFKMNTAYDPSSNNTSTFDPDVYLTPSSLGTDGCNKSYVQFDGITSFSGGGAGVGVGNAFPMALLPVEFLSFTAINIGKENLLEWQTASEENNAGFEIERSNNARDWQTLSAVEGKGTTEVLQNYEYLDQRPMPGYNYYRLKQIDFDGSFEYSEVRTILMEDALGHKLEVFPNPSDGKFTLGLHNPNGKRANIKLFDSTGSMIWEERFSNEEVQPYWEQKFDLPQHEVYFIVTQIGDQIETKKVVIIDQK